MEVINKTELRLKTGEIVQRIREGAIFIHPTDTIYGLGCNALDKKAVEKIRKLKERPDTPFSVWAPSLDWIKRNCLIDKQAEEWLAKLPGPYTLVLKLKNSQAVADNVSLGTKTLGVRYPNHWLTHALAVIDLPIVTTSANKAGEQFMTTLENLDPRIQQGVEFAIYEGEKKAHASKIVNLVSGKTRER